MERNFVWHALMRGLAAPRRALLAGGILALRGLCLPLAAAGDPPQDLPFFLETQPITNLVAEDIFVADLDQDGDDDLLVDGGKSLLWLRSRAGTFAPYEDCAYSRPGRTIGVCDATGDGVLDFFVCARTEQGILVMCHDWRSPAGAQTPLYTLGPFLPPGGGTNAWGDGDVRLLDAFDSDGDGRPEVYFSVFAYHRGPPPRSLLVVDGPTGKELWKFEAGPMVRSCVRLGGIAGSVVVSSWAPDNGAVWNGTADSASYVFRLGPPGTEVWRRETGGRFSGSDVYAVDMDLDGKEEVLVSRRMGREASERVEDLAEWSVAILDPSDGAIEREISLYADIAAALPVDLNRDRRPEVVAVGLDGRLFLLGNDLAPTRILDDRAQVGVSGVADLDANGTREIICAAADRVLVRDESGTLEAEYISQDNRELKKLCIVTMEGRKRLVSQWGNEIRVQTLKPMPALSRSHWSGRRALEFVVLGWAVGSATAAWVAYQIWRRRRTAAHSGVPEEANEELLTAMVAFGHGGATLRVLDRLRFFLRNWDRGDGPTGTADGEEDPMSEARKALEGSVREDLGRIVFLSRRAGVPSAHWKPILAATSRAVALLKSVADGGESPGAHSAQVGAKAALAELDTIDRAISGVRAHLYLVFRASPVETLLRVLAQRRSELERMEVRAEVRISGPLRDTAFASPAVLEKTLDGVIANALRAMEACRERKIECTLSAEGRHVRLDIADSGEGIPPDRWERVFDRHFTTKAEGGFGLHYSREALARFGAKIFINESASGTGTVVRIVLLQS